MLRLKMKDIVINLIHETNLEMPMASHSQKVDWIVSMVGKHISKPDIITFGGVGALLSFVEQVWVDLQQEKDDKTKADRVAALAVPTIEIVEVVPIAAAQVPSQVVEHDPHVDKQEETIVDASEEELEEGPKQKTSVKTKRTPAKPRARTTKTTEESTDSVDAIATAPQKRKYTPRAKKNVDA